jgi:putative addiction module component (TIGR02574 family)
VGLEEATENRGSRGCASAKLVSMYTFENIARQILDLPLEQRSALAERLLASLDELSPEELEQVWASEAERRFDAFEAGRLDSFAGPQVHQEILDEIK